MTSPTAALSGEGFDDGAGRGFSAAATGIDQLIQGAAQRLEVFDLHVDLVAFFFGAFGLRWLRQRLVLSA